MTQEIAIKQAADPQDWAANERKPYWRGLGTRLNLARHTPLQALFMRMIDVAIEEARDEKGGLPTDEAVLAVDWLFRKADPRGDRTLYLMSLENCAHVLDVDVRRLRGNIRRYLRYQCICTAQADQVRLHRLLSQPLHGDDEELFDAPRVVPALDQLGLFCEETIH